MTRGIIIVMTTLAFTAVCGGCHNVRETVEEAAAHANVSYELKDSEKEIIRATNDFSFKLFQSLADNNRDKDFIISPLGVVYSLNLISNGAGGHTKQQLQQQLGTSQYSLDEINALRRKMMLCHAKVVEDVFGYKSAFLKSSNLFLYHDNGQNINQDFIESIGYNYFADCVPFAEQNDAQLIVDKWNKDTNQGLIKDIKKNGISDNLIINTLLFKASWTTEFEDSKLDTFYVENDKVSMVNMMRLTDEDRCLRYMQNEQYAMLRMPYDIRIPFVGCFYMDVLLPNENLTVDSLIRQLDMNQYEKSTRRLDKYDITPARTVPVLSLSWEKRILPDCISSRSPDTIRVSPVARIWPLTLVPSEMMDTTRAQFGPTAVMRPTSPPLAMTFMSTSRPSPVPLSMRKEVNQFPVSFPMTLAPTLS